MATKKVNKDGKSKNGHFTNSRGMPVPLKKISIFEIQAIDKAIELEYRRRGEPIDPPTYEVELAGGATMKYSLSATNLEKEGDEEETKRRVMEWAKHLDALARMRSEINDIQQVLVIEAIDVQLPTDESWKQRYIRLGVPLPQNETDLLEFYKRTQFLPDTSDLIDLQAEVMQLSSGGAMTDEKKEAAKDLFRRSLQEQS